MLNTRLESSPYIAGEKYTIADIASFTWMRASNFLGWDLAEWPAIKAWFDRILEREAVNRGLAVPEKRQMTEDQFSEIVAGKRKEMLERVNTDLK